MNLIQQPNRWSCGITALAMLCGTTVESITGLIGHDGSSIWWPGMGEPQQRRAFHIQELIDVAHFFKIALVEIIPRAAFEGDFTKEIYSEDFQYYRLLRYMQKYKGLIFGRYAADKPHMVAWEFPYVYDPQGRIYNIYEDSEPIKVDIFYAAIPFQNQI